MTLISAPSSTPYSSTSPSRRQPASASWAGALGLVGNVWEWVNDWYAHEYYVNSPTLNPPGPDSGRERVLRGSTGFEPVYAAAVVRYAVRPGERQEVVGFRCAGE